MADALRTKHPSIYDVDGGVDRICDLPQPILHQILSLLRPIDVIRICLLSKTLQSALSSFPVIDLDASWFKLDYIRKGEFLRYVHRRIEQSQQGNKSSLQKLRLAYYVTDPEQGIDIWKSISYALSNIGVEELDIEFARCGTHLIDRLCVIRPPRPFASVVSLNLDAVDLHSFNGVDMGCSWPLLENLRIRSCFRLNHFNFSSTSITSITIESCRDITSLKIQSHSLQNLRCVNLDLERYFGDFDISECQLLKKLSLDHVNVKDNWLKYHIPMFAVLEVLELEYCYLRRGEVVCSKSLKRLLWKTVYDSIEIGAPNLESLSLRTQFDLINRPVKIHPCMHLKHLLWDAHYSNITPDMLKEQVSNIVGFGSWEVELSSDAGLTRLEINRNNNSSSCGSILGVV